MRLAALLALGVLAFAQSGWADMIRLKNGNVLEGKVESQGRDEIRLQMEDGTVSFHPSEIETIEIAESTVAPAPAAAARAKVGRAVRNANRESLFNRWRRNLENEVQQARDRKARGAEYAGALRKSGPAGVMLTVIFFVLSVLQLLCMHQVARKIGVPHAWLIWVPIAQMWPMCRMGGRSVWWMVGMIVLMGFFPPAGMLLGLVFGVLWVLGIAANCGKPPWIGLLLLIPGVHFGVWAYLSLSTVGTEPGGPGRDRFRLPSGPAQA
jgi:hypothetical protein